MSALDKQYQEQVEPVKQEILVLLKIVQEKMNSNKFTKRAFSVFDGEMDILRANIKEEVNAEDYKENCRFGG